MTFKSAALLEQIVWGMKWADWPRATKRAMIDDLANGYPPYSKADAEKNNIEVNVSDLGLTRLAHDARGQMYNGFMKPGNFFTAKTDMGPVHSRQKHGMTVTREMNRLMKRSQPYVECFRSKFALQVLHGNGPSGWDSKENWCPDPYGICDVLVPSGTLLTFKNFQLFAKLRSYTVKELTEMTTGPKVDPGWQMDTVNAALKWATKEMTAFRMNTPGNTTWSPEKLHEDVKADSGYYSSDRLPTIDVCDVYFWDDDDKEAGWRRRIIFDSDGEPGNTKLPPSKNIIGGEGQFLYNPGDRVYASDWHELVHFTFADLSAVAPFRYHSVRSLGWMMYSICHLQNRLRCKFNEAVFENLLMYMRVKSTDEAERALKIQLASRGIIDDSVSFLRPEERWQVNEGLAMAGLNENKQIIADNSSSWVQNQNYSRDRTEKTKYQVMAEVNAMTTLVSAALQQAYLYQTFEYREIFRRFMLKDSRDPDVREFRLRCLKAGVPEKLLVHEAWELEPVMVLGAGNKTNELQIAGQLMEWRNLYPPESQQIILRTATLSLTDDAGLTDELVPDRQDKVTDGKQDAMMAMGSLMLGLPMKFTADVSRIEVCETLIAEMAMVIKRIEQRVNPETQQRGGMATESEVVGLQNVGQTINEQIQVIGQDKTQKELAKKYSQELGNLMNLVKAYGQRLQEQMQAKNGNGGLDPKDKAKIAATIITAKVKAENMKKSHGERTAQKHVQFEQKIREQQQSHMLDMRKKVLEAQTDAAAEDIKTAAAVRRGRFKSTEEE